MFKKARLKLTAWYLVIIMAISLSFSAFIYHSVSLEFERRLNVIENKLDLPHQGLGPPPGRTEFFIEDIQKARKEILILLAYTNAVILGISAAAGYFLAGKTLAPIEKAMEEQKRFVADASHELKTPLTALQTSIEVALRDKKLKLKDAKKTLQGSLTDIDKLTNLSNNLLALARMQQNGQNLVFEKVNIKKVVDEIAQKFTPLAKKKKVTLTTKTKNYSLKANQESLEKLISILLDNAIKYTPAKGKVNVSVQKEGKCLILKVKDTGIGIAKKDLPHIFDRFYRVDTSRSKTKADGFGLGLSIAKEIVKLHHGSISVSSQLGKGATFAVKLPLT